MTEISSELVSAPPRPSSKPQLAGVTTANAMTPQNQSPSQTEQIKRELIEPRTISKKHDVAGRSATARAILETRAQTKLTRTSISEREKKLNQVSEEDARLGQLERQKTEALAKRLESTLVKLKRAIGMGDKGVAELQTNLNSAKQEKGVLLAESAKIEEELKALIIKQTEIPDAKTLIEAYFEKMQTLPLTNEEKRQYLKPEALANLNTEEYIALWRRLNPYFLSHVTRQGFRDHNAMIYHSTGLREFHNGFVSVMEDNKLLRPPLALEGLRTRNEASVREFLSGWVLQAEDENDARERLNRLLNFHVAAAPKYPDITAVHLATQVVADDYYGGEGGNEVFFIFPSDFIASQYNFAFNGWEKDFTKPQSETKWNDVFVWPHTLGNPGIPTDAGFVFLPESTPVDPNTGSKYASEIRVVESKEKRIMIEDINLVNSFIKWGKGLDPQSPLRTAVAKYKSERNDWMLLALQRETFPSEIQKLGFDPDAAAALGRELFFALYHRLDTYIFTDEVLQRILKESGANWKRAENTIPAKEYWENYFLKNPHLRPKHVQYYAGNPTTAVLDFQQQNNIGRADTSSIDGKLLGFDNHHVKIIQSGDGYTQEGQDPRAMGGYKELVDLANRIIADYYHGKS